MELAWECEYFLLKQAKVVKINIFLRKRNILFQKQLEIRTPFVLLQYFLFVFIE